MKHSNPEMDAIRAMAERIVAYVDRYGYIDFGPHADTQECMGLAAWLLGHEPMEDDCAGGHGGGLWSGYCPKCGYPNSGAAPPESPR